MVISSRKQWFVPLLLAGGLWLASAIQAGRAAQSPAGMRPMVETAVERMRPALVRIQVVSTEYHDGREMKTRSFGSGVIISKDGYLVTNHHVAGHATRMVCTLWNREEMDADLIGTDPFTDISVLKLKPEQARTFAAAGFGDSSKMVVGDSVLAMGSPMALSQSVTLGIISNVEMIMPREFGSAGRFRLDGEDVGALIRWIAHDAAIYPGNSGGPLVNLRGEIVGINEISFGLSGAIPGNIVRQISSELIAHGKIQRSWLGFDVQPRLKHSAAERGVLVGGVLENSPASRAGLKPGDLLLSLNGQATNARYEEELPDFSRLVTSLPIGKGIPAVVRREGRELTLRLVPVERGELRPQEQELKTWGLTARNLSFLTAREMKRPNQDGVLVTSVRPGGSAGEAKPAIDPFDVLVEVNGAPVKDLAALAEITGRATQGKTEPTPVLATFEREARRYLTVVKIGLQELRDPGLEVSKAWLPVETHVISRDIARQLGKPDLKGFYITQVYANTAAEKAGLKPGDFILAVEGEKLTASAPEDEEELSTIIRQYDAGAKVGLTLLRGGAESKVSVELERSPKLKREMKKYRNDEFEFTARDIAFFDAAEEQWSAAQRGALVEEVKPGSWAELGALSGDDLIVEVDGRPVNNIASLKALMDDIARSRKPSVVMKVMRGIHTAYLEFEPAWKK